MDCLLYPLIILFSASICARFGHKISTWHIRWSSKIWASGRWNLSRMLPSQSWINCHTLLRSLASSGTFKARWVWCSKTNVTNHHFVATTFIYVFCFLRFFLGGNFCNFHIPHWWAWVFFWVVWIKELWCQSSGGKCKTFPVFKTAVVGRNVGPDQWCATYPASALWEVSKNMMRLYMSVYAFLRSDVGLHFHWAVAP